VLAYIELNAELFHVKHSSVQKPDDAAMQGRMTPSTGHQQQASSIRGADDFAAAFHVSRETLDRLATYEQLLRHWQKTINLVAPSTLDAIWHRHFADSAQLLALAPTATTWLDLGSGAGFPGLVIAVMLAERVTAGVPSPLVPEARLRHDVGEGQGGGDCRTFNVEAPPTPTPNPSPQGGGGSLPHITLIDSNARKCAFLREVVRQTGISPCVTVDILSTRIEAAATQARLRGPEVISARALAPLDRLVGLAAKLSSPRTVGLFLKGRDAEAELKAAEKMWKFNAELVPSRTDPDARVVVIRNLQPKAKAKE
jgi:16S rRNA (guanine527-N7)-methyltransferase